jgi:hypothetical protein
MYIIKSSIWRRIDMKKSGGKVKFGGYKGGRGYCGWYETIYNKKIFLRSMKEYYIAKKLDYEKAYFLTEKAVFNINGKTYKPDFFIYSDAEYKNLKRIIEVKNSFNEAMPYFKYVDFFNSINIEYEVIYNIDIRKKQCFISSDDILNWKKQYVQNYNTFEYSGEKNPMFGVKHSNETKNAIGKKTAEYMKNPNIKMKHSKAIKDFWKSDIAITIKKKYAQLRHDEKLARDLKNPDIKVICKNCGRQYIRKQNAKYHKETCSNKCIQEYNWKIGKNTNNITPEIVQRRYKTKVIKNIILIPENITEDAHNSIIKKYKNLGIIQKNFGMNLNTIIKYFGSFNNFILEINNGKTKINNN